MRPIDLSRARVMWRFSQPAAVGGMPRRCEKHRYFPLEAASIGATIEPKYDSPFISPGSIFITEFWEVSMFDSLADRIREDEHREVNQTERIIRWVVIAVVSVVIFGGLYYGVRMLG